MLPLLLTLLLAQPLPVAVPAPAQPLVRAVQATRAGLVQEVWSTAWRLAREANRAVGDYQDHVFWVSEHLRGAARDRAMEPGFKNALRRLSWIASRDEVRTLLRLGAHESKFLGAAVSPSGRHFGRWQLDAEGFHLDPARLRDDAVYDAESALGRYRNYRAKCGTLPVEGDYRSRLETGRASGWECCWFVGYKACMMPSTS